MKKAIKGLGLLVAFLILVVGGYIGTSFLTARISGLSQQEAQIVNFSPQKCSQTRSAKPVTLTRMEPEKKLLDKVASTAELQQYASAWEKIAEVQKTKAEDFTLIATNVHVVKERSFEMVDRKLMEIQTLESHGGPFLLLAQARLPQWGGSFANTFFRDDDERDYEVLCDRLYEQNSDYEIYCDRLYEQNEEISSQVSRLSLIHI